MFPYRVKLKYDGAHYFGWQVQSGSGLKTIQGELNSALEKITKGQKVSTIGSGRTDAGVHALGQIVKIDFPFEIDPVALMRGLNSLLPKNIRVLEAHTSDLDFHPVFHAKSKEYIYAFTFSDNPFYRDHFTPVSFKLDLEQMNKAASLFIGKNDFKDFYTVGTPVKSTIREIYKCEIQQKSFDALCSEKGESYYQLVIEGSGFMKQMVRLIMGTLFEVGKGNLNSALISKSLSGEAQGKLGPVAPPNGLYLHKVSY